MSERHYTYIPVNNHDGTYPPTVRKGTEKLCCARAPEHGVRRHCTGVRDADHHCNLPALGNGRAPLPALSIVRILTGIAGICIGFFWVLASAKILRGLRGIRHEYRKSAGPVPAETLTGWIVAMLAHYRENRTVIRRMTFISIAGGVFFLALGIANLVQGSLALPAAARLEPGVIAFFGAGPINLGIGIVTICFALRFRRYAGTWDLRLERAGEGEEALRKALESR